MSAFEDPLQWVLTPRDDDTGEALSRADLMRDEAAARAQRARLVAHFRAVGDDTTASRLERAGAAGYPGSDEIEAIAQLLGGSVEVWPLDARDAALTPPLQYGTGPLVMRVGSRQLEPDPEGHAAQHYDLLQIWALPEEHAEVEEAAGTEPDK